MTLVLYFDSNTCSDSIPTIGFLIHSEEIYASFNTHGYYQSPHTSLHDVGAVMGDIYTECVKRIKLPGSVIGAIL